MPGDFTECVGGRFDVGGNKDIFDFGLTGVTLPGPRCSFGVKVLDFVLVEGIVNGLTISKAGISPKVFVLFGVFPAWFLAELFEKLYAWLYAGPFAAGILAGVPIVTKLIGALFKLLAELFNAVFALALAGVLGILGVLDGVVAGIDCSRVLDGFPGEMFAGLFDSVLDGTLSGAGVNEVCLLDGGELLALVGGMNGRGVDGGAPNIPGQKRVEFFRV